MIELKAPENRDGISGPLIFLAGSIEMGTAELWQDKVSKALQEYEGTILNPRRDDWDSSWEQTIENENFKEQVEWELSSLDMSNIIFFYFDPNTKSPISLMELGKYIDENKKLFIVCPDGFWRKGNVEVICNKYNEELYNDIDSAIKDLIDYIVNKTKLTTFKDYIYD